MQVRLDLYADADAGAYSLAVVAHPAGLASTDVLAGRSADLILDSALPKHGARCLTFATAVASPLVISAVAQPGRIVFAYLYHPLDEQALLAFDARITEEYSAFYAVRGVFYTGTYHVTGPAGGCIGELLAYDTASRERAQRLGTEDLSECIIAIEDECRALQDRARRRYGLWLLPRP
jgi:hypothetical protein